MTVNIEAVKIGYIDDGEGWSDEDAEKFLAGKVLVLPFGVRGFPFGHALIALKDDTGEHSDDDAFVAELTHETAVSIVNSTRNGAEVADVVVEGVTVDMIDGVAGRDVADESEILKAGKEHRAMRIIKS